MRKKLSVDLLDKSIMMLCVVGENRMKYKIVNIKGEIIEVGGKTGRVEWNEGLQILDEEICEENELDGSFSNWGIWVR